MPMETNINFMGSLIVHGRQCPPLLLGPSMSGSSLSGPAFSVARASKKPEKLSEFMHFYVTSWPISPFFAFYEYFMDHWEPSIFVSIFLQTIYGTVTVIYELEAYNDRT